MAVLKVTKSIITDLQFVIPVIVLLIGITLLVELH